MRLNLTDELLVMEQPQKHSVGCSFVPHQLFKQQFHVSWDILHDPEGRMAVDKTDMVLSPGELFSLGHARCYLMFKELQISFLDYRVVLMRKCRVD